MSSIRIVINALPLLSRLTGIGNCIYNISKSLLDMDHNNRYTFYYGYFSDKLQMPDNIVDAKFGAMQKTKFYIEKISFIRNLAKEIHRHYHKILSYESFDVYFEPNFIPIDIQAKQIVTTVHDFSFHVYPEWHPKDRINYFRKHFYKRIYKSDFILTDSNYIKEEAKQFLRIDENRIRVIHMGYDNSILKIHDKEEVLRFRNLKNLPENFILFVGSIEPRKNIEKLLHAYMHLPKYIKEEFKLIIIGFTGWENQNILNLIKKMKDHVILLGYLSVQELSLAYNAAKLFAYPSVYEGFGLPPLEAMACGCPVVVSNVASLPEVCGDAAYYVNPHDVESLTEGIHKVLTDEALKRRLIEKGLERIKLFTWEKTAKEHIKVFEEVLKS